LHSAPAAAQGNARVEETLATMARQIAGRSPKASIKFIARHEKETADGVLRLAFDGTAARGGWVRQNGQASPFFWWEDLASPLIPARCSHPYHVRVADTAMIPRVCPHDTGCNS
jgi:hypothetical protein